MVIVPAELKQRKSQTVTRPRYPGPMQVLTAEEVILRLADSLAQAPPLGRRAAVAFDGDGTLWSGDVGEDFFHATVALRRYLPPAVDAMRAVARGVHLGAIEALDVGDPDAGVAIARGLFQGYLDHVVPEDVICEVIAWVCAGWREEDVTELARDVVEQGGLAKRRHEELGTIAEWARGAGVEPFLVSASPRPVVEAAGKGLGFDREHILAATAPFVDGVMLAEVVRPIPYGPGKAALLASRLEGRPLLGAFGDNIFDVPMLRAARVAVVVEPKPKLLAYLEGEDAWAPPRLRVALRADT